MVLCLNLKNCCFVSVNLKQKGYVLIQDIIPQSFGLCC